MSTATKKQEQKWEEQELVRQLEQGLCDAERGRVVSAEDSLERVKEKLKLYEV